MWEPLSARVIQVITESSPHESRPARPARQVRRDRFAGRLTGVIAHRREAGPDVQLVSQPSQPPGTSHARQPTEPTRTSTTAHAPLTNHPSTPGLAVQRHHRQAVRLAGRLITPPAPCPPTPVDVFTT